MKTYKFDFMKSFKFFRSLFQKEDSEKLQIMDIVFVWCELTAEESMLDRIHVFAELRDSSKNISVEYRTDFVIGQAEYDREEIVEGIFKKSHREMNVKKDYVSWRNSFVQHIEF